MRQNHAKQRPSGFHPHGQFPYAAVASAMQPIQSISRKASDQHMASTATTFPRNCSRCVSFIAGATKPSNPVIPISKDSHPPKTRHSIPPAFSIPRLSESVGRSLISSQPQRKGLLLQSLTTEQCNTIRTNRTRLILLILPHAIVTRKMPNRIKGNHFLGGLRFDLRWRGQNRDTILEIFSKCLPKTDRAASNTAISYADHLSSHQCSSEERLRIT